MGELLYADGTLNPMTAVAGQIKGLKEDGTHRGGPGSPEIAWQSNAYTRRGGGAEDYTPRFTFHGFRYVEVTGFPGTPTLESIEGLRLNTDVEPAGSFACSNERFNRLHEIVQWTFLKQPVQCAVGLSGPRKIPVRWRYRGLERDGHLQLRHGLFLRQDGV